eukprot:scaffold252372_cov26-Tisochrysis_lutea.AAC.2
MSFGDTLKRRFQKSYKTYWPAIIIPNNRQRAPTPAKSDADSARSFSRALSATGATTSPTRSRLTLSPGSASWAFCLTLAASGALTTASCVFARRLVRIVSAGVEIAPATTPAMAPPASETKYDDCPSARDGRSVEMAITAPSKTTNLVMVKGSSRKRRPPSEE